METKLAIFQKKEIRKTTHNKEWWFVIEDIVVALTDTVNAKDYIKKVRKRDSELAEGWGQIVTPLSINTAGGVQKINCANTEGIFRIIQSIPSPKAEPFEPAQPFKGYQNCIPHFLLICIKPLKGLCIRNGFIYAK